MAMDSGNVAAYHTGRIWDAVCGAQDTIEDRPGALCQPFFTYWLRSSSWGLAIHKEARMIAISSNNPEPVVMRRSSASVTLFAFALVNHSQSDLLSPEESPDRAEYLTGWFEDPHALAPDRSRNSVRTLFCHLHNIPSISFINTDEDREGRFLLTTSINGEATLWDTWHSQAIIERHFGRNTAVRRYPDDLTGFRALE